jgi:hypothetical protein
MQFSFLSTDFKEKDFRFFIKDEDLTEEIEKMLNNEKVEKFTYEEKSSTFLIKFNNLQYEINKTPVTFRSFLDKKIILFRIFTEDRLYFVLDLLKTTYAFYENDQTLYFKDIKFDSKKEIVLVPYIYIIYRIITWWNKFRRIKRM